MPDGYQVNPLSVFSADLQNRLASDAGACWALGEPVLRFIYEHVAPGNHTLEIGSGLSTLVFAARGAVHMCVTPSTSEKERLTAYASQANIPFDKVTYVNEFSELALPNLRVEKPLDVVLIDGKHAFPWPFVDWFYTVNHLRKGGLLLVDDTHLITGKILCDFMKSDPGWEFVTLLDGKTEAFRKLTEDVRNVAWHMQPFVTESLQAEKKARLQQNQSLYVKIKAKVKQMLS